MALGSPAIAFHDLKPGASDFRADVLEGLARPRKEISPKYFYDEFGSALFLEICELDEYYPTRAELEILDARGGEIAARSGAHATLVEFGSGANCKIRALLDGLERPAGYVSIDISRDHLIEAAGDLAEHHPTLSVVAICADYTEPLELPPLDRDTGGRRVGLFFGSTIGNLTPVQAQRFLRNAAAVLGPNATMVIGVDLKKDKAVLEAAYDDAKGVTAAFNKNLLTRINRELDADFTLDAFVHVARYDGTHGRIEMHLKSLAAQRVTVAGQAFDFAAGETIHTENSYKYTVDEFRNMAGASDFVSAAVWTDSEEQFSLHYLKVAAG